MGLTPPNKSLKTRQILLSCIALLLYFNALVLLLVGTSSSSSYRGAETKKETSSKLLETKWNTAATKRPSLSKVQIGIGIGGYLSGPGSSPPRCISKCAACTPCKPVRVPVKPGTPRPHPAEYYPEAWRCKCRNRLYMP